MTGFILGIILVLISSLLVWQIRPEKQLVFKHLLLLLITPWLIVLLVANPQLKGTPPIQARGDQIITNLSFYSSFEFLFFSGDGRPFYNAGDYGVFIPSFLPLILLGLSELHKNKSLSKNTLYWLFGGGAVSLVTANIAGLPSSLWFVPALSIFATLGVDKLVALYKNSISSLPLKVLVRLLSFWIIFEGLRLYQILFYHQPLKPL